MSTRTWGESIWGCQAGVAVPTPLHPQKLPPPHAWVPSTIQDCCRALGQGDIRLQMALGTCRGETGPRMVLGTCQRGHLSLGSARDMPGGTSVRTFLTREPREGADEGRQDDGLFLGAHGEVLQGRGWGQGQDGGTARVGHRGQGGPPWGDLARTPQYLDDLAQHQGVEAGQVGDMVAPQHPSLPPHQGPQLLQEEEELRDVAATEPPLSAGAACAPRTPPSASCAP